VREHASGLYPPKDRLSRRGKSFPKGGERNAKRENNQAPAPGAQEPDAGHGEPNGDNQSRADTGETTPHGTDGQPQGTINVPSQNTHMKPSQQAIEARIKIVNYLSDQMSRPLLRFQEDEIELIIQATIDEAIEKHVDDVAAEWEKRYIELEARLMRSQHNHAEAVKELNECRQKAESRPAQECPNCGYEPAP